MLGWVSDGTLHESVSCTAGLSRAIRTTEPNVVGVQEEETPIS